MATYKLIQDVEAEDHILGPLTLKQFIYGLVAAFCYYLCFVIISKHVAVLLLIFLPPALLATFFALPFKRDQPTEVWALAKVRFLFKPRKRIWDQSGITEMVTITAPKKVEKHLTKTLTDTEVEGRLSALASMLDSRGWAIKNLNNSSASSSLIMADTDRLIDISSIPPPVPDYTEAPGDDMLGEQSPLVNKFTGLINSSTATRRQQLLQNLRSLSGTNAARINPADEHLITTTLKQKHDLSSLATANLHSLVSSTKEHKKRKNTSDAPRQKSPALKTNPAILNLASNDDLSISAIANEIHRSDDDDKEVVVELH